MHYTNKMPVSKKNKTYKSKKATTVAEPAVSYITIKSKKNKTAQPVTEENWALPGRPATDEELEKLAEEMANDTGEYTIEEAFAIIKKKQREWRKQK